MQLFLRTPTRFYFILLFVVVSMLFSVFSLTIYHQYTQTQRVNAWIIYNYDLTSRSNKVLARLVDMETGVRGYLLTGKDSFLEPYENARKTLAFDLVQLSNFTKNDPESYKHIALWREKIDSLATLFSHDIRIRRTQDSNEISAAMLSTQKSEMDDLRALLSNYVQVRLDSQEAQINVIHAARKNFRNILTLATLFAIAGMVATALTLLALIERNQKVEKEAKTVESRLLQVVNGINDGLYDFNLAEGTMYFSPAYKAMLGYSEEEHPNTAEMFNSTLHPDDYRYVWNNLNNYKEGKTSSYSHVYRIQHKGGHWISVLSRGMGLTDSTGKMTRLIGTHSDVTDQRQREEELQQLNNEMETFAYITSHDLRVPLVNIRGFAGEIEHSITGISSVVRRCESMLDEKELWVLRKAFDEDIPEAIRFITQSVNKMDRLTSALLDLSRIGKRSYQTEQVDMNVIVRRCLDTLAYEITQKEIEVTVAPLPSAISNPLALEQIFGNILDNAVKYLEPRRRGKITVSSQQIGRATVFSVTDNGRGISEADRDKVFQIFRRARNTSDIRGLGMGMTFVQATLRHLGGSIWFDSTSGVGTSFHFSLTRHVNVKELSERQAAAA